MVYWALDFFWYGFMIFEDSYIGKLRAKVGHDRLIVQGASVIIENDRGELLMHEDFEENGLRFPGGIIEENESLWQTALREIKEEFNLDIKELVPVAFRDDPRYIQTLKNGDECVFHAMLFFTNNYTGECIVDKKEIKSMKWVSINNEIENISDVTKLLLKTFLDFKKDGKFRYISNQEEK